jgi:hypothetical protein
MRRRTVLDELQTWWGKATPETQAAIQTGGLVLGALLGGHLLGLLVARALRARNFDAALRAPGSPAPAAGVDTGITPTLLAGLLVRLTVWAGAAWWLAHQHGRVDLANTLGLVISRAWALAAGLIAALAVGGLLARRLVDCLQALPKPGPEAGAYRNGAAAPQHGVAGAVGAGVYGVIVLLALVIAADLFDWPLTRGAVLALWQFAQRLLIAGAALLVGCLGARWARDLVPPGRAGSPENRAGQYTALGIVTATTLLAVAVVLSGAGLFLGLVALAVLGFLLWAVRGYLPDLAAGLQLWSQHVREVWFDGLGWVVSEVGFITTQVTRAGEFCRLPNRQVLEAHMQGAPAEAGAR